MNAELFESGIHTENSDIRAHVSVVGMSLYVFETRKGVLAMEEGQERTAGQPGVQVPTARGVVVPWEKIGGIRKLRFSSWPKWSNFHEQMTTSQKGRHAVDCVTDCMRIGRFPFWIAATEDEREHIQIKGTDIVVFCKKNVQVKCDWRCGAVEDGGSGNIFLQIAERNPLRRF